MASFTTAPTDESGYVGLTATFDYAVTGASSVQARRLGAGGGGGGATLVQSSTVGAGFYSDAIATFPNPVTAGNLIIIFGGCEGSAPVPTSSQGETITVHSVEVTVGYAHAYLAFAVANGGTTSLTHANSERNNVFAQEWSGLTFDAAAGVGAASANSGTITPTTPNASSVADSVTFTAWSVLTGDSFASQTVATGFTEAGRNTSFSGTGQWVGGYRVETVTGAKSASWVPPSGVTQASGAVVLVFSGAVAGPTWQDVAGATLTGYTTPILTLDDDDAQYQFEAIGTPNALSTPHTLNVLADPGLSITTQPADQTGAVGETDTYNVTAAGVGLTYQWFRQDPTPP